MLATNAYLNSPVDVFVSSNGNVYISEYQNHYIRMVNVSTGIITTVAGNGTQIGTSGTGLGFGYNGDGIPATYARLTNPQGIFVTSNNEIYIADAGNFRIRKVLTNGTIITVAGTGEEGYNGDGMLATAAKLE